MKLNPVVVLLREYREDCTLGSVVLPSGNVLKTMELPWKDNEQAVSAIPEGVYLCRWMESSASGKYERCWLVENVEGRSGILWHPGNTVNDTYGCILPGFEFAKFADEMAVTSSRKAMDVMRGELGGQDFILVVSSFSAYQMDDQSIYQNLLF